MPRTLRNEIARSGTIDQFLKFFIDCEVSERQRIFVAIKGGTISYCVFPVEVELSAEGKELRRLAHDVAKIADRITPPQTDAKAPASISDAV